MSEAAKANRLVYTFDVPVQYQSGELMEGKLEQVGIRKLTVEEEKMANNRASEGIAKAEEVVKASWIEATINGETKRMSLADGSVDSLWKQLDPQQRTLIASAYSDVNMVKDDEVKPFLSSRKVKAS